MPRKVRVTEIEKLPMQGIGNGNAIAGVPGLWNIVRGLLRLMRDKATCTVVLKLHDGEFTDFVGLGNLRMRLGMFGLERNRTSDIETAAKEVIEKVVNKK